MDNLYVGTVVFFNPKTGFGFIEWKNDQEVQQQDMFCHFSDINMEGFKTLYKGQKVSFSIGTNKHGLPKATNILLLKQ